MESPKKKKEESLAELVTGGLLFLVFSPCIVSAIVGMGSFLFDYFFRQNPEFYSLECVSLVGVAFVVTMFYVYTFAKRTIIIVKRIYGILQEHRRLNLEVDTEFK